MQIHALPYLDLDVIPLCPGLFHLRALATGLYTRRSLVVVFVRFALYLAAAVLLRRVILYRTAFLILSPRVSSVSLGSKSAAPGASCVSVAMRPFPALNSTWSESLTIRCCLSDRQQGWKRAKDDCPSSMLVVFRPRSRSCHQLFWTRSPLPFLAASHPQTAKTVA